MTPRGRASPRSLRGEGGADPDRGACQPCLSVAGDQGPNSTMTCRKEGGQESLLHLGRTSTLARRCPHLDWFLPTCPGCSLATPAWIRLPPSRGSLPTASSCWRPWSGTCSRSRCADACTRSYSSVRGRRASRTILTVETGGSHVGNRLLRKSTQVPTRAGGLLRLLPLTALLPRCAGGRDTPCATSARRTTCPARRRRLRRHCRRTWNHCSSLPCRTYPPQPQPHLHPILEEMAACRRGVNFRRRTSPEAWTT